MIDIVTGYHGKPHVQASQQGTFNAGLCGYEVVLPVNERFAYTLNSNNSITIKSGDAVVQGRHITIPFNSSETLTIENGKAGYNRIDSIVIRYKKDLETSVETAEVLVIKGIQNSGGMSVEPPEISQGDIFAGAVQHDFLLYNIHLNELNITQVEQKFNIIMNGNDLTKKALKTVETRILTAGINSDITLTANDTEQKINLSLINQTGDGFYLENGSIKIGEGINKVLIQGSMNFVPAGTGGKAMIIYRNSTSEIVGYENNGTNYYKIVNAPAKLISVNEGDSISLFAEGNKNDTIGSSNARTFITIQAAG